MITIETPCPNISQFVYRANCATINKTPKKDKTFDKEWCLDQLHAQHSTLEFTMLYVYDDGCRGDVVSHLVRHTKGHPRFAVQSHRPDWTGHNRPAADTQRKFLFAATPYAIIEMMRQRLCVLSSIYTQEEARSICDAMKCHNDIMVQTLGEYCMSDCEYRGGVCHQSKKRSCGRYRHWTAIRLFD